MTLPGHNHFRNGSAIVVTTEPLKNQNMTIVIIFCSLNTCLRNIWNCLFCVFQYVTKHMLNCTNYIRKSLSTSTSGKFIVQHTAVILFCKHMSGNYLILVCPFQCETKHMLNCTTLYEKKNTVNLTSSKFIAQHTIVMARYQSLQTY